MSLRFGSTLLSFDRASFSIGYFLGSTFGGTTVGCTAVSFGCAAFSFRYASHVIGYGEGHCAPSTVREASQIWRSDRANRRTPGSSMYGGETPARTYARNVLGEMPR
ncbi:hypothetical protein GGQ85_000212 [Nitrobacter vulgaris]|jgi:hypothetical protein|nr:hypothetical protein [Nitrobacter vulgaris]MDR6302541.1 hypothetical protein [Nitrobacter vulgaris]